MGIFKPQANPQETRKDSVFGSVPLELANNLEWLLASGQAKDEQVAEALVEAYYPSFYQVALATLNEASAARRAAREIIAAALINAYRYSSDQPVSSWLASLAVPIIQGEQQRYDKPASPTFQETFTSSIANTLRYSSIQQAIHWLAGLGIPAVQADTPRAAAPENPALADKVPANGIPATFAQFPQEIRLVAALHYLLDLPPGDIARVLKKEEWEVENQLQFARSQLMIALWGSAKPAGKSTQTAGMALSRVLKEAWPTPHLTEKEHSQVVQKSVRAAERQRRGAHRSNALKEILAVGVTFVLVGVLVWRTEILKPEPRPTPTAAPPAAAAAQQKPTPRPATRTPLAQSYKPPSPVWPTMPPESTSTPFPMEAIYRVRGGDTLETIAESLGVSAKDLASYNRILPEQPLEQYQVLVIPGRIRSQSILGAFPTSPAPTKAPLTTHSTIDEVAQQSFGLFEFYQNKGYSLWMDQVIHIYGGEAFQGPEQSYRFQVWMGSGGLIMASGKEDSIPAEVLMIIVNPDGAGGMYISRPESAMQRGEPAWFMDVDHMPEEFAYLATGYLMQYLDSLPIIFGQKPEWLNGAGKTTITGSQKLLDRQALVIEQRGMDAELLRRAWIDAQTGLMLGKQEFSSNGQSKKWEVETTGITVDYSLNPSLFNPHLPWRGGYAADADGDPTLFDVQAVMATAAPSLARPQPLPAPPAGFNATKAALTLRAATAFNIFDPQIVKNGMPVDLYAGDVYLTSFTIGEPNMTLCTRSPDGNILAVQSVVMPFDSDVANSPTLKLLDLRDAGSPDMRDSGLRAYDIAFSPDGQKLAVSGRREFGTGVFIWDLTDESSKLLTGIGNANSATDLTWSPDGQYLALIHDTSTEGVGEVLVLQIAPPTGRRVFQGSLTSMEKDADGNYTMKIVVDSLPEPWEIHFRDNALDLDSCLRAPGS